MTIRIETIDPEYSYFEAKCFKKLAEIYRATQRDEEAALLEQRADGIIANLYDIECSLINTTGK